MSKKLTKFKINKLIKNILYCNCPEKLENLSRLLYSGEINFADTFGKSADFNSENDVDFCIDSSTGCFSEMKNSFSKKELRLWYLIEMYSSYKSY